MRKFCHLYVAQFSWVKLCILKPTFYSSVYLMRIEKCRFLEEDKEEEERKGGHFGHLSSKKVSTLENGYKTHS